MRKDLGGEGVGFAGETAGVAAGAGAAGAVGAAAGALCDSPVDGAGGLGARTRSGSPELHARRARDQAQDAASCGSFPLSVCLPGARPCWPRSRAGAA